MVKGEGGNILIIQVFTLNAVSTCQGCRTGATYGNTTELAHECRTEKEKVIGLQIKLNKSHDISKCIWCNNLGSPPPHRRSGWRSNLFIQQHVPSPRHFVLFFILVQMLSCRNRTA